MKSPALALTFPNSRPELAFIWQLMVGLMGIKIQERRAAGKLDKDFKGYWECEPVGTKS